MMPLRILSGLFAATAVLAAHAAMAAPAVAPDEDVQAAVDAAEPGSTVELLPGLHRGPVRLDRAVTLAGRDGIDVSGETTAKRRVWLRQAWVRVDGGKFLVVSMTGPALQKAQLDAVCSKIFAGIEAIDPATAMKLREDFYQQEVYGPRVRALESRASGDARELFEEFDRLLAGENLSHKYS